MLYTRVYAAFNLSGDRPTDPARPLYARPNDDYTCATESVVSPLGWTAADVRRRLRDADDASLAAYR